MSVCMILFPLCICVQGSYRSRYVAVGVTYDDRECVHYFRVESSKYPSPTKSGYFLVGSTPLILPKNKVGFYNKECLFRNVRY
uniref:Secreted protein n=1 Tax=Magallana gigas TaxID=29159 RepID=A0A8W8P3Y8_MAGGI